MPPKRKTAEVNSSSSLPKRTKTQKKKEVNLLQLQQQKELLDLQKRQTWFDKYADPDDPNVIRPDGCQNFFSDLDISLESISPFIVGWKLGSQHMGYFNREEWNFSLKSINITEEQELKKVLADWEVSVLEDPADFKQLYIFTFGYVKTPTQKSMDVETAITLWNLILEPRYPIINSFIKFLEEVKPVRVVNKDQWSSLLDFCKAVPESLDDYDSTSSWPVLFDDYVEWRKSL